VQRVEVRVNAAVELHDSQVIAVEAAAGSVVVRLSAYVHRSDGRPGFDAGSCWSEPVVLVFAGGTLEELPPELPCTLDDGRISGDAEFAGLVPLPASIRSPVQFEALGLYGEQLLVRGAGFECFSTAEGKFIEAFPGARPTGEENSV